MSKNVDPMRLSRRGLLKATGGLAGAAALAGTIGHISIAEAQDAVTVTLWGNHPEWKAQSFRQGGLRLMRYERLMSGGARFLYATINKAPN